MAKFIKLTAVWGPDDNAPMCALNVNVDHVMAFSLAPETKATGVLFSGASNEGGPSYVLESPEQILALIEAKDGSQ